MSFRQFKLFHTSVCFQLCFFIQFASGRFIVDSSSFRLVTHYKGMHVIWSSTDTWRRRVSLPLTSLWFLLFRWAGKQETNDQYVCNIAITRLSFENRIMIVSVIHDELRSGFTLTATGKCTKNSVIHKTKIYIFGQIRTRENRNIPVRSKTWKTWSRILILQTMFKIFRFQADID